MSNRVEELWREFKDSLQLGPAQEEAWISFKKKMDDSERLSEQEIIDSVYKAFQRYYVSVINDSTVRNQDGIIIKYDFPAFEKIRPSIGQNYALFHVIENSDYDPKNENAGFIAACQFVGAFNTMEDARDKQKEYMENKGLPAMAYIVKTGETFPIFSSIVKIESDTSISKFTQKLENVDQKSKSDRREIAMRKRLSEEAAARAKKPTALESYTRNRVDIYTQHERVKFNDVQMKEIHDRIIQLEKDAVEFEKLKPAAARKWKKIAEKRGFLDLKSEPLLISENIEEDDEKAPELSVEEKEEYDHCMDFSKATK